MFSLSSSSALLLRILPTHYLRPTAPRNVSLITPSPTLLYGIYVSRVLLLFGCGPAVTTYVCFLQWITIFWDYYELLLCRFYITEVDGAFIHLLAMFLHAKTLGPGVRKKSIAEHRCKISTRAYLPVCGLLWISAHPLPPHYSLMVSRIESNTVRYQKKDKYLTFSLGLTCKLSKREILPSTLPLF